MFGLKLPELLIILLVLVLLFGSKKIPDLGNALGKGIRAFRDASDKGGAGSGPSNGSTEGQKQESSPPPRSSQ